MVRDKFLVSSGTLIVSGSLLLGQAAQKHDEHAPATHTHAAAAKIANPVKSDEASIAAGQTLYETNCVTCHGTKGAGDGVQASKFTPRPSDLADAQWKHGPTDGEIFTVIRSGVPKTSMSSFAKKVTERQTWDLVNYVRSLGPQNGPPHVH